MVDVSLDIKKQNNLHFVAYLILKQ